MSNTSASSIRSQQIGNTISDSTTICGSLDTRDPAHGDEDDGSPWICSYDTFATSTREPNHRGSGSEGISTDHFPPLDLKKYRFGQAIKPIRDADTAHLRVIDDGKKLTKGTLHPCKIIQRSLRSMRKEVDPYVSCVPVADDLFDLLGSIEGPLDTPYAGGVFYIRISIPKDYPFKPPTCRFLTKVLHPNIDPQGRICLSLFGEPTLFYGDWSPAMARLDLVLISICALLSTPNITDALVPEIADQYLHDRSTYDANARLYTTRYATGVRPSIPLQSTPPLSPILPPPASTRRQSSTSKTRDDLRNVFERLYELASNYAQVLNDSSTVSLPTRDEEDRKLLSTALKTLATELTDLRTAMMGWGPLGELQTLKTLAGKCVNTLDELKPIFENISTTKEEEEDQIITLPPSSQPTNNNTNNNTFPSSSSSERNEEDEDKQPNNLIKPIKTLSQTVKSTRINLYGSFTDLSPSEKSFTYTNLSPSSSSSTGQHILTIADPTETGNSFFKTMRVYSMAYAKESFDRQRWDPMGRKSGEMN
ncbi:MAG: hypothetical protein M1812_005239 [Candelaria pacifica]|nr:MAG: hypothetical protein M1812_005239 [Candelaria pacifica]